MFARILAVDRLVTVYTSAAPLHRERCYIGSIAFFFVL